MRLIALILSVVVSVLSFVPCADASPFSVESSHHVTQSQEHDHERNDSCTPFCTCACCAVPFYNVQAAAITAQADHSPKPVYAVYPVSPVMQVSFSIWQPPRW